ncbi:Mobile element protein [Candidatus Enterovibrio altilux]|uniref:Mobile element protein n=1 Tax=Candidatus Enterovibrio altilux TaxID=1927128 RepID=A0A291BBH5_9GAMM|nr:Mobile element protein [Candidatus Enterovibrio luxaltus]
MLRVKKLLGGLLSLRDHNAQIKETYIMIKTLNKLTGLSMLQTKEIV